MVRPFMEHACSHGIRSGSMFANRFVIVFVIIFKSVFRSEIGRQFVMCVGSLWGFGINVMVAVCWVVVNLFVSKIVLVNSSKVSPRVSQNVE